MTESEQAASLLEAERLERTSLDGHTLEELGDYLDRGREPVDPSIEGSPACQIALDNLARLQELSLGALETEAASEPVRDDGWISRILELISIDAQAGRDIPLDDGEGVDELVITEGAVRGIVRAAGDEFEGILLGRVRLIGDVTVPDQPIHITVDASIFWGQNIRRLVGEVRESILTALSTHTRLNVIAVDVTVQDIEMPTELDRTQDGSRG